MKVLNLHAIAVLLIASFLCFLSACDYATTEQQETVKDTSIKEVETDLQMLNLQSSPVLFVADIQNENEPLEIGGNGNRNGGRSNKFVCCGIMVFAGNDNLTTPVKSIESKDKLDNPFGELVTIKDGEPVTYTLSDEKGGVIYTTDVTLKEGEAIAINKEKLTAGTYTITITIGEQKAKSSFEIGG